MFMVSHDSSQDFNTKKYDNYIPKRLLFSFSVRIFKGRCGYKFQLVSKTESEYLGWMLQRGGVL